MIEAALRSLLLAFAVGAGLRIFRVRNVLAQKSAWGLVLVSASVMPLLLHWQVSRQFSIAGPVLTLPSDPVALLEGLIPTARQINPSAREAVDQTPATDSISEAPAATSADLATIADDPAPSAGAKTLNKAPNPPDSSAAVISEVYSGAPVSSTSVPPVRPRPEISWALIAGLLYVGVAGALLLRLLYGLVSALHLWNSAEQVLSSNLPAFAAGLPLRCSRSIPSPVTIGSGIVLPANYDEWDTEKLRIVLAHERSHIRQGDFYLQLLAGLYAALVWISPLGWWLKLKLSELAETISDRAGLEQAVSGTSYAQILLEFAAAPRPSPLGVAMARPGSLSRRIERLLNDGAFRQAFAGGRRRALVAVLLVPVALYAATALVRVQAAQALPAATPAPAAQPAPSTQVATPSPSEPAETVEEPRTGVSQPDAVPAPEDEATPSTTVVAPIPPHFATSLPKVIVMPPMPKVVAIPPLQKIVIAPIPPISPNIRIVSRNGAVIAMAQDDEADARHRHGFNYRYSNGDDSYAIISGDHRETMNFNGDIHTGEIDKARKMAHGDFLWFERDGKQYFVDDAATIAQIEAMYKPIEELGKQQEALGKQQEELGRQQEALGRLQEQASVPTPDMRKEMAEISEAMAKLQAKMGKNITADELGDLQGKLGDLQGRLGDLQGKIGDKQGELGAQQGKLGDQQGKLGAEQGRLGAEQGRLARDADHKVRSIIDESLQNGKAHPVE
jgi:beta-lactamase regulating signal transducer with metallopeptidase domain